MDKPESLQATKDEDSPSPKGIWAKCKGIWTKCNDFVENFSKVLGKIGEVLLRTLVLSWPCHMGRIRHSCSILGNGSRRIEAI